MKLQTKILVLVAFILSAFFISSCEMCSKTDSCSCQLPEKEIIQLTGKLKAIGPYSTGVKVGNTLYVSGQIPMDPETGEIIVGDVQKAARVSLGNLKTVIETAGFEMKDVVRATVFLSDMDNYGKVNEVYAQFFTENYPARVAVEVARLPKDVEVEISAIAIKCK